MPMVSVDRSAHTAAQDATRAARSVWIARLARFGLASRGVLYLLLTYLAMRVAFGQPNRQTDRTGALHTIARQPFGQVVLAGLAVGFAGYSVWQLSVAALGDDALAGSDQ